MRDADRQQDRKPSHHQCEAAVIFGEPLELDRQADPEKEREQNKTLGMERENKGAGDLAGHSSRLWAPQKLFEDRNPEFGRRVDHQHDEQSEAAKDIDGADPFGWGNRTG